MQGLASKFFVCLSLVIVSQPAFSLMPGTGVYEGQAVSDDTPQARKQGYKVRLEVNESIGQMKVSYLYSSGKVCNYDFRLSQEAVRNNTYRLKDAIVSEENAGTYVHTANSVIMSTNYFAGCNRSSVFASEYVVIDQDTVHRRFTPYQSQGMKSFTELKRKTEPESIYLPAALEVPEWPRYRVTCSSLLVELKDGAQFKNPHAKVSGNPTMAYFRPEHVDLESPILVKGNDKYIYDRFVVEDEEFAIVLSAYSTGQSLVMLPKLVNISSNQKVKDLNPTSEQLDKVLSGYFDFISSEAEGNFSNDLFHSNMYNDTDKLYLTTEPGVPGAFRKAEGFEWNVWQDLKDGKPDVNPLGRIHHLNATCNFGWY